MARIACGVKKNGNNVIVLPTDFITWNKRVADLAPSIAEKLKTTKGTEVEAWSLGDFSETAHNELEKMGWKIHTRVHTQLMPNS